MWLTFFRGHLYQQCPVVHIGLLLTDYPSMQSCVHPFCAEMNVSTPVLTFLKQEGYCGSFFRSQQSKLLTPQLSFASDAAESIETLGPARVCMFSQDWSLRLAAFESNLCTSVKFLRRRVAPRSGCLWRSLGSPRECVQLWL